MKLILIFLCFVSKSFGQEVTKNFTKLISATFWLLIVVVIDILTFFLVGNAQFETFKRTLR